MSRLTSGVILCLALTLVSARPAAAAGSYFNGTNQTLSNYCVAAGVSEPAALSTFTGYFTDGATFPATGGTVYVHAYAVNQSACSNDVVGFEFFLPDGASLDISSANPVYCFRGYFNNSFVENVPNSSNSACLQMPEPGNHGGYFFGYSALPNINNWFLEIQVPVHFTKKLNGIAGPSSDQLQVITSSTHGTANPFQPVTVFYQAGFESLTTTGVTTTTATSTFQLDSYFDSGVLDVDLSTTNPPAQNAAGGTVSVPNTAASFPVNVSLSSLTAAMTYYWRGRFVTSDGTFLSPVQTFTTAGTGGTTHVLTVTNASGVSTGTVTSTPGGINCGASCTANFASGASVTLNQTPASGYTFSGWGNACTGSAGCSVTMSADKTVTALFTRQVGSLTVQLAGLPNGTSVTLSLTGPDGFHPTTALQEGFALNYSDTGTGLYTITAPAVTVGGTIYAAPATSGTVASGATLTLTVTYAAQGQVIAGDFDGDGKADMTFYKTTGDWGILRSSATFAASTTVNVGGAGNVSVPGDYDGDGRTDPAVYNSTTGQWQILTSSSNYTTTLTVNWGGTGYLPEPGDYDGDGKTDPALYVPATGQWLILKSSSNYTTTLVGNLGGAGYTAIAGADFDGDHKADLVVYRASTGVWYYLKSNSLYTIGSHIGWGGPGYAVTAGDFDGDGKADLALYLPSSGSWYILESSVGYLGTLNKSWGGAGYDPVALDVDGDGKLDLGVVQRSTGNWSILLSSTNYTTTATSTAWGAASDTLVGALQSPPTTSDTARASDVDGDGKADFTLYTFSGGSGSWYTLTSSSGFTASVNSSFGGSTYTAVPGDFDGDGKADRALYQPATGTWVVLLSSTAFTTTLTKSDGGNGWTAVPADYDGDGKTDFAAYNTSTGQWYVLKSGSGYTTTISISYGGTGYTAVPGDFDGDGKADIAVYQQSTGNWSVLLSSSNYTSSLSKNVGGTGYVPVQADYDGDGKTDFVVYNTTTGLWYGLKSGSNYTTTVNVSWGGTGYTPIKGDFDGDGRTDLAVYRASTGVWSILLSSGNYTTTMSRNFGGLAYQAVPIYP
jgi:hypothetical protein